MGCSGSTSGEMPRGSLGLLCNDASWANGRDVGFPGKFRDSSHGFMGIIEVSVIRVTKALMLE